MSLSVQSVNVILIQQQPCGGNVRNRRSMAISKGCAKERETAFCFPRFPSVRHFHRFRAPAIFLARTREMICDAMVVERLIDRRRYRKSLLHLAERMMVDCRVAVNALGMFDANILEERIMMMRSKRIVPSRLVRGGLAGCVIMLLLAAVIGGIAFAKDVAPPSADHNQGSNQVYTAGPDVAPPTLEFAPDPEFPKSAKLPAGTNVVCVVGLVVDRDGMLEDVHIVRSAGKTFDDNAMRAVRQYRFKPGLRRGDRVAVAIKIEVNFRKY